jgi:hypothetical protein
MSTYGDAPANPGLLPYRIGQLESFRRDVESWRLQVDKDRNDLEYLAREVAQLKESFDSLRKTLLAFAFTLAGSAVVFALSVMVATGKIGGH